MKKEHGFVKAKLIFRGGCPPPGTQASKNIPVSIGLNRKTKRKECKNQEKIF